MKEYLERMFRYAAWANGRAAAMLRGTPAAQAEGLPILAHLLAAEHVWLARLQQRAPSHPVRPALDLDACAALAAENEAGYRALLSSLGETQGEQRVRYRTSQGQEFENSVRDILTHVLAHGPYHRGQIAKAVGRSGGAVLNTDFIIFVREFERGE